MSLKSIIDFLFLVFYILLWARIIFSFIRVSPYHPTWGPVMRFVYDVTEPILAPVRRILPPMAGFDLSPLIVFLLASFLQNFLNSLVT